MGPCPLGAGLFSINYGGRRWIALGSAAETECLIDLAQEAGYLGGEIAGPLRKSVDAALALLHGTLRSPGESR